MLLRLLNLPLDHNADLARIVLQSVLQNLLFGKVVASIAALLIGIETLRMKTATDTSSAY